MRQRALVATGRSGRHGFTIAQLLAVLVVIAVAASLGVVLWFDRSEVTLDNATRLLAEDLRRVQNRAALRHERFDVVVPEDGDGYRVQGPEGAPASAPIGAGAFERSYSSNAIFRGVAIGSVQSAENRILRYDERGFALGGATIVLSFRGEERTVRIADQSGRIEVEGLEQPWLDSD